MKKVIFTIANDYYYPQVEALYESFRNCSRSKGVEFIWIRMERRPGLAAEWIINCEDLLGRSVSSFAQYSVVEAATAIKPRVFRTFFQGRAYDEVIYIDPDTAFYSDPEVLFSMADGSDAAVTPHILEPYYDSCKPDDLDILRSGSFNLGFLYLKKSNDTIRYLNWWASKTLIDCTETKIPGVFTDQKWCENIPSFIKNFKVLRSYGLNFAYWNVHERRIELRNSEYFSNGERLIFAHYSGISDPKTGYISRHSSRGVGYLTKDGRKIFEDYYNIIKSKKTSDKKWSYEINVGYNKYHLPHSIRHAFNDLVRLKPTLIMSVDSDEDVVRKICLTNGKNLPQFIQTLFVERPDVYKEYLPEITKGNIKPLLDWIKVSGKKEIPGIHELPIVYERNSIVNTLAKIYFDDKNLINQFPFAFHSAYHFHEFSVFVRDRFNSNNVITPLDKEYVKLSGITGLLKLDHLILLRRDIVEGLSLNKSGASARLKKWLNLNQANLNFNDAELDFIEIFLSTNTVISDLRIRMRSMGISFGSISDDSKSKSISIHDSGLTADSALLCSKFVNELTSGVAFEVFNYFSYGYAASGLGVAAKNLMALFRDEGVKYSSIPLPSMLDFSIESLKLNNLIDHEYKLSYRPKGGSVNFYHCNFDMLDRMDVDVNSINIAYSVWEVNGLTNSIVDNIKKFDCVFAPSVYSKNIFGVLRSDVKTLSHNLLCVKHEIHSSILRRTKAVVFGYFFDIASVVDRKNPFGLLDVYENTFGISSSEAKLILKINRADANKDIVKNLISRVIDNKSITLIFDELDEDSMNDLWSNIDVYISLHRAEGFGLTIMEAMQRGIPVIATGFSGICDEISKESYLAVDFDLINVRPGNSPYGVDSVWAEPNPLHASRHMRDLMSSERRKKLGSLGKREIHKKYSSKIVWKQFLDGVTGLRDKFIKLNA